MTKNEQRGNRKIKQINITHNGCFLEVYKSRKRGNRFYKAPYKRVTGSILANSTHKFLQGGSSEKFQIFTH